MTLSLFMALLHACKIPRLNKTMFGGGVEILTLFVDAILLIAKNKAYVSTRNTYCHQHFLTQDL